MVRIAYRRRPWWRFEPRRETFSTVSLPFMVTFPDFGVTLVRCGGSSTASAPSGLSQPWSSSSSWAVPFTMRTSSMRLVFSGSGPCSTALRSCRPDLRSGRKRSTATTRTGPAWTYVQGRAVSREVSRRAGVEVFLRCLVTRGLVWSRTCDRPRLRSDWRRATSASSLLHNADRSVPLSFGRKVTTGSIRGGPSVHSIQRSRGRHFPTRHRGGRGLRRARARAFEPIRPRAAVRIRGLLPENKPINFEAAGRNGLPGSGQR